MRYSLSLDIQKETFCYFFINEVSTNRFQFIKPNSSLIGPSNQTIRSFTSDIFWQINCKRRADSSAKIATIIPSRVGKSLVQRMYKIGPRILLRGTPALISSEAFIFILGIKPLCHTLPKAQPTSKNAAKQTLLFLQEHAP